MIQDISYFNHTLDEMKIQGTHKRIWLKQFKRDPKKTTQQFYNKLDRLYSGWRGWEIAKKLLIEAHPNLKEPQPWAGYEKERQILARWCTVKPLRHTCKHLMSVALPVLRHWHPPGLGTS